MTIVVTGATGHLGRLIIEDLIERGVRPADIVATGRDAVRLAALATDAATAGVATAVIDFSQPQTLERAFADADTLMFVSGSEVGQRVEQHRAVVAAAEVAGIRRIVYTSVLKATTTPLILAPEHRATEEAIVASGISYTFLRNGWYSENYLDAAQRAGASGAYASSTGGGRISSASREDYAAAAAVVLTTPGHENTVYELSGDEAWTASDFAEVTAELFGREVVYTGLTTEQHAAQLSAAGLDAATVGFVTALDADTRAGLLGDTSGDLARLIGRPTTPLIETLRSVVL